MQVSKSPMYIGLVHTSLRFSQPCMEVFHMSCYKCLQEKYNASLRIEPRLDVYQKCAQGLNTINIIQSTVDVIIT